MDYHHMITWYWATAWTRYRGHIIYTDLWYDQDHDLCPHYYTHIDGELVDDHEEAFLKGLIDQWHEAQ
jgi:hypothetical protein